MPESRLNQQQKESIRQRADGCCEYCLSQVAFCPDPFSIEHIIPRSKGGRNDLDNLAIACQGCNNFKYSYIDSIDPITGKLAPLYHPRQDRWHDHFGWSDDAVKIIGLTMTGRATIERLQLNRTGVVNLRRLLVTVDQHPPQQNS
jgi:HNH endonuclease